MANVTKPNTFSPNTTIASSEVNDNFDTIYNEFNGNISAANLATGAVTTTKIADDAVTGDKIAAATVDETNLTTAAAQGWYALGDTPDTVTYNGNRSYDLVFNSNDLTDTVSNGQRLKLTRTVTPPTQCTDLEASSSQYWLKTSPNGISFTDDFTVMAWVKMESYHDGAIISKVNGTQGFKFNLVADGRIQAGGYNAGLANYRFGRSYQSIPLNKWVHIAVTVNMSAASHVVYIDGVAVPTEAIQSGTNPTSLVQAGNLEIGGYNGGTSPFDGKIAQAALFDAVLSASTIKSYASQTLAGNETNCIGLWKLNGDGNDSNANANDLSAQNSATATTVDSPFNATEYGIITANSFSTNTTLTVQVPEGYAIPTSGGVSAVSYSTQDVPYGFPRNKGKWRIATLSKTTTATTSNATYGSFSSGGFQLTVPVGAWKVGHRGLYTNATTTTVTFNLSDVSLTGLDSTSGINLSPLVISAKASAASNTTFPGDVSQDRLLSSQTTFTMQTIGATTSAAWDGLASGYNEAYAEFNYV